MAGISTIPAIYLQMYKSSANGRYVLSRDEKEILRGTEQDVWHYIHTNHCYSVDHALKYEGYSIQPER